MELFGDKSYFYHKDQAKAFGIPMPVLDAKADKGKEDGKEGELLFAKEGDSVDRVSKTVSEVLISDVDKSIGV